MLSAAACTTYAHYISAHAMRQHYILRCPLQHWEELNSFMHMNTISLISSPTFKIEKHLNVEIPLQLLNVPLFLKINFR